MMPDLCSGCGHWKSTGPVYMMDTGHGTYRLELLGYCKVHGDKGFGNHILRYGMFLRSCDLFETVEIDDESLPQG